MAPEGDFQHFQSNRPQVGTITQWDDEKGYGWVKSGVKRVFVHIKDFERGQRRPQAGEDVRYIPGVDSNGRSCAQRVTFLRSGGRVGIGGWLLLFGLLVLPGLAVLFLPLPLWMVPGAMATMSAITYVMYADDKKRAMAGAWRVPESSLHMAELLGGWPGAFLAQRRLRHKCSKFFYQVVFWIIVVIFQIVAVDVILDWELPRALFHGLAH
jgi:uncharacterized membrane protein YsdA (DUF1294 family)/cold shock CspA family protein